MASIDPSVFDRFTQQSRELLVRLRVRSALNPVLVALGCVTCPSLIAVVYVEGNIRIFLLALGSVPLILLAIGFLYFMIRDPDKLQSEEYQLQKKALDIIEEKGGKIQVLAASLDAIANPTLRQLPPGQGKE